MAARSSSLPPLKSLQTCGRAVQRRLAHGKAYFVPQGQQAHPIGGFYQLQLDYHPPFAQEPGPPPFPHAKSEPAKRIPAGSSSPSQPRATPKPQTATPKKTTKNETVQSSSSPASTTTTCSPSYSTSSSPIVQPSQSPGPSIIFGSRLNESDAKARQERLDSLRRSSTVIMGVLVPPRPEEPDNCCMSGCFNCVWDGYREEMEMWADANEEVDRRMAAKAKTQTVMEARIKDARFDGRIREKIEPGVEIKGGEKAWDRIGVASKKRWDDKLYQNLPIGIREFMRMEKKFKDDARR